MKRSATTMNLTIRESGRDERGSALIIAVLISVILSLLGISYMLMAQTENTIAENERNASMALYVAESGARLSVNWLNRPNSTGYLLPNSAQVDVSLRLLDQDNDPNTARVLASTTDCTRPTYKAAACTASVLFDRPYRPSLANTFSGVETGSDGDPNNASRGPDLIVTQAHLDTINNTIFPNFPTANLRAKVSRIEFYSPPIVNVAGVPTRMGVATVKVIGGVFIFPGTAQERQIATRVVKAVVNEIPVPGPVGPLQSCTGVDYGGEFAIHWGTGSAQTDATFPLNKANPGLPYALNDPNTYYNDGAAIPPRTLATWATGMTAAGSSMDDPWLKFVAGGVLSAAGAITTAQPWPEPTAGAWPAAGTDHSNLFQHTVINCPTFDYAMWKSIAQSGNRNMFYYKWSSADQFKLDGAGSNVTFANATGGRAGVFFFDTTNGEAPFGQYTDPQYSGSGSTTGYTNLTPGFSIASASGWLGGQGFLYMNSKTFGTTGVGSIGSSRTIFPPGEPGDGTGFVNLQYPSTLNGTYAVKSGIVTTQKFLDTDGTWYCTDTPAGTCSATSGSSASPVQDSPGLPFLATVVMDGVFYNSGTFTAQGNANYFGSLVAQQGVLNGAGNPGFYFDERLIKGNWPPPNMDIPRVIVSSWQVDM